MKRVLIVSSCGKRRNTIGLIGNLLSSLEGLDKTKYHITLLDTNFFELNHNPQDYNVDCYKGLNKFWLDTVISKIPRIRVSYANHVIIRTYSQLLSTQHFDIIIVYQIPAYADKLVEMAHANRSKIVFEPFGSDILRVSGKKRNKLMKAFAEVDGVCGRDKSGAINAAINDYKVPVDKLRLQNFCSEGVKSLIEARGKKTRQEMMKTLSLPYSDYNIVCGYSGRKAHRHKEIIESLIQVKEELPDGYQIIFPMTYGAGAHHEIILEYAAQLKEICDTAGLNAVFLTEFMSGELMSYLHLVTDLFIEIQPTDNGNAFMIEALFAGNQIVTGSWLKYERFEQFGVPYYLIESPTELPTMLHKIFTNQVKKAVVPQALIDYFNVPDGNDSSSYWADLCDSI